MSWSHWHILCQCYLVEYAPRLFPGSSCHLQEFLSLEGRNPFYPAKKAEPGIFRVPEVFFIPGQGGGGEHGGIGPPVGWEPVQPLPDMPPLFWNVAI